MTNTTIVAMPRTDITNPSQHSYLPTLYLFISVTLPLGDGPLEHDDGVRFLLYFPQVSLHRCLLLTEWMSSEGCKRFPKATKEVWQ